MTAAIANTLHLLGWSLLHFLWQGAVLMLALATSLAAARNRSPQIRYALCCTALALMVLCPIVTFAYLSYESGSAPQTNLIAAEADNAALTPALDLPPASASLFERFTTLADRLMPWTLTIWIAGVLLLLARAIAAGIAAQRLKTASLVPASESLLALASRTAQRLGIAQAFEVFASHAVTAPTVIGWLKPVILFPVASLAGLAPEQLEALLAHELAHIRRRDYLVNALQMAAETLLFYHPAVWWVSRQIRRERELCCDDIAVAVTGSPLLYAKALYQLEEQRALAPQLMLGSNGGQLTMRIKRLLTGAQSDANASGPTAWLLTAALLALTGALAVSTLAVNKAHAQNPAPAASATSDAGHEIPPGEAAKHVLYKIPPRYPDIAQAAHISGTVKIAIVIGPTGDVTSAHVLDGPPMLRQAALDSVIHWKFSPFTDSGEQPVTTTLRILFSLPDSDAAKDDTKPDLSCTYYDAHTTGHPGTCVLHVTDVQTFLCRRNDDTTQTQLQIGCKQKIEAQQASGKGFLMSVPRKTDMSNP